MTVNLELLQLTLVFVKAHPENWWQEEWRCGTACCFAGHAALLSGAKWVNDESAIVMAPNGRQYHVADYAASMLRLTESESDELFSAQNNSVEDLEDAIDEIARGVYRTEEEITLDGLEVDVHRAA